MHYQERIHRGRQMPSRCSTSHRLKSIPLPYAMHTTTNTNSEEKGSNRTKNIQGVHTKATMVGKETIKAREKNKGAICIIEDTPGVTGQNMDSDRWRTR
eukprot:13497174-Ditylum_brightwellii.AAC.1